MSVATVRGNGADVLVRGARLFDAADPSLLVDVVISDGRIVDVGAGLPTAASLVVEANGGLLLPGFVDTHLHLDKAFLWDNPAVHGTTRGAAFEAFRVTKAAASQDEVQERMLRALRLASQHGVTTVRAQVDVDEIAGLRGIRAALALREACADWISLQVVAFPQEGLLARPPVVDLLRTALAEGADAVGGGAALDPGVAREDHLQLVFSLAREYDCDVDLHADLGSAGTTPPEAWEIQQIAQLTRAFGWEGRVSVAHLTGLGAMDSEPARELAGVLRDAGIAVVTVPGAELHTAAGWKQPPIFDIRQALTNVHLLLEEGVTLSLSTGHVCDPLNPRGRAQPLADALLLIGAVTLGEPSIAGVPVLRLVTDHPAQALRLRTGRGIGIGDPADLVLLGAPDHDLAVRTQAPVQWVAKAGRTVVDAATGQHLNSPLGV